MENAINEKKKKSFSEWCKDHPKTVFITRVILWALFAAALPFAFIAWRYQIFSGSTGMELTGWGIIAVIIVAIFLFTLIKYLFRALKPGLAKQCLTGALKVILPLVVLFVVLEGIKNSIALFEQALGCVIICETIAIPLNPFPVWLEQRKQEEGKEKIESITDLIWDRILKRKKDEE